MALCVCCVQWVACLIAQAMARPVSPAMSGAHWSFKLRLGGSEGPRRQADGAVATLKTEEVLRLVLCVWAGGAGARHAPGPAGLAAAGAAFADLRCRDGRMSPLHAAGASATHWHWRIGPPFGRGPCIASPKLLPQTCSRARSLLSSLGNVIITRTGRHARCVRTMPGMGDLRCCCNG